MPAYGGGPEAAKSLARILLHANLPLTVDLLDDVEADGGGEDGGEGDGARGLAGGREDADSGTNGSHFWDG